MFQIVGNINYKDESDKIKQLVCFDISTYDTAYVLQEGISYGSSIRTKSIFDLAGLNYLLRNVFIHCDGYVFTIATPANIKKFATGKGNAKKQMIVENFLQQHKKLSCIPKVDDIADAYFMAQFARNLKNKDGQY